MSKSRDTIINTRITLVCVSLLLVTIVLYLYFLNMSVVQVVMRADYMQQQHDLKTEIAILESSFIEAQYTISNRLPTLERFIEPGDKIFVARDEASLVLGAE